MNGREWSGQEERTLRASRAMGISWGEIAKKLGRSDDSVFSKAKKLHLMRKTRKHKEADERTRTITPELDGRIEGRMRALEMQTEPLSVKHTTTASRSFEHRIIVDGAMSVTLRIPEVLTVTELRGMLLKTNRLFNLSGQKDELISTVTGRALNSFQGRVGKYVKIPQDVQEFILKKYTGENIEEMQRTVEETFGLALDKNRIKQAAYRAGYVRQKTK